MKNLMLREATKRTLNHLAMGMMLGGLLASGLLFGNGSKFYALTVSAYGNVDGAMSLLMGCALMIGVGAVITGFIFDEVERS